MKKMLLSVLLITFMQGCATRNPAPALGAYPNGSVVINNRSPYTLRLFLNGAPWKDETPFPVSVQPKTEKYLPCPIKGDSETVEITAHAVRVGIAGCLVWESPIGDRRWYIRTGTNLPAQVITTRSKDF